MLPSRHIIVSLPLAAIIWSLTQSLFAGLLCFISGVLIDLDHLIDCTIHSGLKNFNFKEFYRACGKMAGREEEGGVKKLYLVFHAIEIAILLWLGFAFTKNIYVLAIALGYTGHLMLDVSANAMKPWGYFMSWRMKNSFVTIKLIKQGQS